MDAAAIDPISLNFNRGGLLALNAVIGLMMYGMALDMKLEDFKRVIRSPKGPAIGLAAQFILLPAFTFLLTLILPVTASMALGMMLVAACPGGNLSNVVTSWLILRILRKPWCPIFRPFPTSFASISISLAPSRTTCWAASKHGPPSSLIGGSGSAQRGF